MNWKIFRPILLKGKILLATELSLICYSDRLRFIYLNVGKKEWLTNCTHELRNQWNPPFGLHLLSEFDTAIKLFVGVVSSKYLLSFLAYFLHFIIYISFK